MKQITCSRNFRLLVAVLFCMISVAAVAQSAGFGAVSGVVTDSTGAVVAGAHVNLDNPSKGIHRETESTSAGTFDFQNLVPAAGYTVKVMKGGFGTLEYKDVTVQVGENVTLAPKMGVAGSQTSVEVTSEAPTVDTSKTSVSTVVTNQQIQELPTNGRRVDSFLQLQPGVTSDGSFGLLSFRGTPGGNNFLVDGVDTTNSFYNENGGRTRLVSNISIDAVQEFQLVTSNFSAEFGKANGGVVNTVTRSGSNSFHGSAYEFFRNKYMNSIDKTASGIKAPDNRHQAGLSFGGPIVKERLWYFFNGEIVRRENPLVASNLNNNIYDALGNIKTATNDNCNIGAPITVTGRKTASGAAAPNLVLPGPTAAQCSAAIAYLNGRALPQLLPRTVDQNLLFGKIDYRPNEKDTFTFSSNYLDFNSPNGLQTQLVAADGAGNGNNADSNVKTRNASATWTRVIRPTLLNQFRFGYFKDRQLDDAAQGVLPVFGPAALTLNNVSNLGYATNYPRLNPSEQKFQLSDSFTWMKGKHSLKFGGEWYHTQDYVNNLQGHYASFTYSSMSQFAADFSDNPNPTTNKYWSSYSQTFGNGKVDLNMPEVGFFVQDDYKVMPKLTLSLGLRYEHAFVPQPPTSNPLFTQTAHVPSTNKDFAPRFGFNYALNEKTTVHGGIGMYYGRYTTAPIENLWVSNNTYTQFYSLSNTTVEQYNAGPAFGAVTAVPANVAAGGTANILFADNNFRNPYSYQANFGIDREIAKGTTLSVSGVWSRTLHLQGSYDTNLKAPATDCVENAAGGFANASKTCYTYKILDASGVQTGLYTTPFYTNASKINPAYGRISALTSSANSYYDGLLVSLSRRYSNWLTGGLSYTWAHTIDMNIGGTQTFGSTTPSSVINGNFAADKGDSTLDQRHRLSINAVLSPTIMKGDGFVAKYLVNKWQLSVAQTAASSQGTNATVFVNSNSKPAGLLNTTLNGLGGSSRVPFIGTNSLKFGNIYKTDLRLSKMVPVSERVKVQLGAEMWNAFNTTIPGGATPRKTQMFQTVTTGGVVALQATPDVFGVLNATQGPPDGTTSRRSQLFVRINF